MLTTGLIALFLASIFFIVYLFLFLSKKYYSNESIIQKQVQKFSKESPKGDESSIPFIVKDDTFSKIPILNKILQKLNFTQKLKLLLIQADSKTKVGDIIILIISLSLFGVFVGLITKNIVIKLLIILLLGSFPILNVLMKRNTRVKSFIREFPDAIEMMISALKAGHAFTQSMQMVGIEAPDPVGIEFKKTFEEHNLGRDLRESLLNLTERVPSLDLKLFVTAILLQRETGGNLTEILENISHTIRERFKLIGQMKIYTAQGRMSGLIIGSLPIVFVLIMSVLNPDYLKPLIQEKMGHYFIASALILQIIGFIWIRKIVKIKLA